MYKSSAKNYTTYYLDLVTNDIIAATLQLIVVQQLLIITPDM